MFGRYNIGIECEIKTYKMRISSEKSLKISVYVIKLVKEILISVMELSQQLHLSLIK